MLTRLARVGFYVLLCAVVYLSWKPSPSVSNVPWMPAVLGGWFDQHDFAKNVIGYGVFALTGFVAWSWPTGVPGRGRSSYTRRSLTLLFSFCGLVLVLELGQLALPYRTCDPADVLAGWVGILLAWAILQIARFILSGGTVRQASSQPHPATTD